VPGGKDDPGGHGPASML